MCIMLQGVLCYSETVKLGISWNP